MSAAQTIPEHPPASAKSELLGRLPILFETNVGQAGARYKFLARQPGIGIALAPDRAVFGMAAPEGGEQFLTVRFQGRSRDVRIEAVDAQDARVNYLVGNDSTKWQTQVPTFRKIRYKGLYPGIDLVFYGNGRNLEHDFVLAPGSNPKRIALRLDGSRDLSVNDTGDLVVKNGSSELRFKRPVAYQPTSQGNEPVEASYRVQGSLVSFEIPSYDPRLPLVIDPILTYSTWLAGSNADTVAGIAVDQAGNSYVAGLTSSPDFPTKGGYVCNACTHQSNIFVTKLDPSGANLVYSTYIGGSGGDEAFGVGIDGSGNLLVAGLTGSPDFPLVNSYTTFSGRNVSYNFVLSLSSNGSQLNYSSLLGQVMFGGSFPGPPFAFTVDALGNAYAASRTYDPSYPITPGTLGTTVAGYPYNELFVSKLDPTGSLSYSTVIPGTLSYANYSFDSNDFIPYALAVDSTGSLYIGGKAGPGLPTTSGTLSPAFAGDPNNPSSYVGFLLKINPTASSVVLGTYVPYADFVHVMALHGSGIYIGGSTGSGQFPTTLGAFETTCPPGQFTACAAGYIGDLNLTASAYNYATFLAGTPSGSNIGTNVMSLDLDANGNLWASGATGSFDFPVKIPVSAMFPNSGNGTTGFVTAMKPDLSSLVFSTLLSGSSGIDHTSQLYAKVGPNGTAFVAGNSDDTDFPTTPGSFAPHLPASAGLYTVHTIVAKIDTNVPAPAVSYSPVFLDFGMQPFGNTSPPTAVTVTNVGNANLQLGTVSLTGTDFTETDSCPSVISPGASCQIDAVFTPTTNGGESSMMTVTSNAFGPPQVLWLQGIGIAGFGLTAPGNIPLSQTVVSGQTATYTADLNSAGFTANVSLSCSGAPQYAACTVSPNSVSLTSNPSSQTITVRVTTSQTIRTGALKRGEFQSGKLAFLFAVVVAPFTLPKWKVLKGRRSFRATTGLGILLVAMALGTALGCGGGGGTGGGGGGTTVRDVAPGTYTLLLQATVGTGTMTSKMNLTLVVQ